MSNVFLSINISSQDNRTGALDYNIGQPKLKNRTINSLKKHSKLYSRSNFYLNIYLHVQNQEMTAFFNGTNCELSTPISQCSKDNTCWNPHLSLVVNHAQKMHSIISTKYLLGLSGFLGRKFFYCTQIKSCF